ncbi:hypothetical protein, partial [Neobacillus vireti]|uniref:hypothetical protein n=1 Tax=Neobacillus vireti TaxID=220686 RepID=UPI003000A99C
MVLPAATDLMVVRELVAAKAQRAAKVQKEAKAQKALKVLKVLKVRNNWILKAGTFTSSRFFCPLIQNAK